MTAIQNDKILVWANQILQKYGKTISELLREPIPQINFIVGVPPGAEPTAAAWALDNGTIYLNPDWNITHKAPGEIVHEMTHVFLQAQAGESGGVPADWEEAA